MWMILIAMLVPTSAADGFTDCVEGKYYDASTDKCYENECETNLDCPLEQVCLVNQCEIDLNADDDRDGVPNFVDNCSDDINPAQLDLDSDGIGDDCDDDVDDDGLLNSEDNCPELKGEDTSDLNADGQGDICDPDDDGDSLPDVDDNCPNHSNYGQADADNDGQGDECDLCPYDAAVDHLDTDGDGLGDICDPDDDGDCVLDVDDNCVSIANEDQVDSNGDGRGDACDLGEGEVTLFVCDLGDALDDLAADSCCTADSGEPGACGEDTCLVAVCELDDYCCVTSWDSVCADIAESIPEDCGCSLQDIDFSDISYP